MSEEEKKVIKLALHWYTNNGLSGKHELWCAIANLYSKNASQQSFDAATASPCKHNFDGGLYCIHCGEVLF